MAWSAAIPRRESLGSALPQYGSNTVSPVCSPRSDNEDSGTDTDTDGLIDAIQRAKAAESAGIKSHKRSMSLSRTKHKRNFSSSERPDILGLPQASFERNDDGSPRVAAVALTSPLLAAHKLVSTGGISPAPFELKKSKKNKSGGSGDALAGAVTSSQDAQLATLVAQTKAIQAQITRMSGNMDTLYTVSTKQLERIYNNVDELGRTGRIAHVDDNLQLIEDDTNRKGNRAKRDCCCQLI